MTQYRQKGVIGDEKDRERERGTDWWKRYRTIVSWAKYL
jgi:hypothetical protein